MRDWLEIELSNELPPASAPEELWRRITGAGPKGPGRPPRRPWVIAAALTVLTVGTLSLTLRHASAEASCQRSQPITLTNAGGTRSHDVRVAAVGSTAAIESPQNHGCQQCHAVL